ncbi:hypothetical protein BV98_000954 [Sphingobium herbicidovorans NBRC 16415]|uniref:Trypsin-co-occurring domain-containing protein n=1 Tax=Sphingobium herbicidovorans (strain ATCC 700291 / DSM 11019 / CCUG 56400 / KCTC 2939 / LMG 18315 / NBRC 16415 / MH) TaxID=1219045 RepID=A0A086PCS7_SPHHM|nr:hypothetical protein BV98_000954 [Sphingobium herbicidovorans NBRC 16415]
MVSVENEVDSEELSAFVTSTLRAISTGITNAGVRAPKGIAGSFKYQMPKNVSFDVAVTVKHSNEAGAGLKVQVLGIGAGMGGSEAAEKNTVSRVAFEVPWVFETFHEAMFGPQADTGSVRND